MAVIGLLLGIIGRDINSRLQRFVFGISLLADGLDFVALTTGLFGLAEVITCLSATQQAQERTGKVESLSMSRDDRRASDGN